MSKKVMLFFEDVDDPRKELIDRKLREYEELKTQISLGDAYSSVKFQLENPDLSSSPLKKFKANISSFYAAYKLSSPQEQPDGTFFVDCSSVKYGCWCVFDEPELLCRLYFDREQKLISIVYLDVTYVSYKQVRHLYDQEDYPAAYKLANEAHQTNPNLKWPMRILPWLLIHLMKANARAYSQRKFFSLLEEFKSLEIPEDNKKLWGAVAWPIRDIVRDSIDMQWFTPQFGDELFTVIWIMPFDRPSESYSSLVKEFVRLGGLWPRLTEFIEWWGFDNFTDFDYRRYPEDGKLESLAEKVYSEYLISLHRKGNGKQPAKAFFEGLDHLALRSKEQADKVYKTLNYDNNQ